MESLRQSVPASGDFGRWTRRWMEIATFNGAHLPGPGQRTQSVLALWNEPIPGSWKRGPDPQLLGARYRRGDAASPHPGEHAIEHEILANLEAVRCLEATLLDGVNAMPLSRDETGGRSGNVEADLFLLAKRSGVFHLVIGEVKDSSNTPWFAAIESLRQLRLLHQSEVARRLFHYRFPHLPLPAEMPIVGLVIAPEAYYLQRGQKGNSFPHAVKLLRDFMAMTGIEAYLAVWDPARKSISRFG